MEANELEKAVIKKTIEFEIAMETEKPHMELLRIYKELKMLQFQRNMPPLRRDHQERVYQ